MKSLSLICILISIFVAVKSDVTNFSQFSETIQNIVIPCALSSGMNTFMMPGVQKGDFSNVTDPFGCFVDCVSKKIGFVSADDVFQKEVVVKKMSNFASSEAIDKFLEKCSKEIKDHEQCKVTGQFYHCVTETGLEVFNGDKQK
ncbi:hypothetical protein DMENIID0001_000660 [Sergentomyia squamirostris]